MADQIIVILQDLRNATARVVKAIAFGVVANLTAAPIEGGTPIDTGWASANWIPEIGVPYDGPYGTREDFELNGPDVSARDAGTAKLLGYSVTQGKVFITNAVPYILQLNDGSSRQAAAGFVEAAIEKAVFKDLKL